MARYFGPGGVPTGLPLERLLALGAEAGGDPGVFNMAALGIRMAARVNGVSRLHGERGARDVRAALAGARAPTDVPITHVTNGVHAETWVGPEFAALYRARLGDGYGARTRRLGAPRRALRRGALRGARATPACASSTRCAAGSRAQAARARRRPGATAPGWPTCSTRRRSRSASRGACRPTSASRCCCASASG